MTLSIFLVICGWRVSPSYLFCRRFVTVHRFINGTSTRARARARARARICNANHCHARCVPMPLRTLPRRDRLFSAIFDVNILCRHRSPFRRLRRLGKRLMGNNRLILRALIVRNSTGAMLIPRSHCTRVGGICFLPSITTLVN